MRGGHQGVGGPRDEGVEGGRQIGARQQLKHYKVAVMVLE